MRQSLGLYQEIKQSQKMTPLLQQSIRILQLPRIDLIQAMYEEVAENIMLELGEESQRDQVGGERVDDEYRAHETPNDQNVSGVEEGESRERSELQERESHSNHEAFTSNQNTAEDKHSERDPQREDEYQARDEMDWETYFEDHAVTPELGTQRLFDDSDQLSVEANYSRSESLFDHLLWQLQVSQLDETERRIALEIIGNLNEYGFLMDISLADIAEKYEVDVDDVEEILQEVQCFDPIGVGARGDAESLLIQARFYQLSPLAISILESHYEDMAKGRFNQISRSLKSTVHHVQEAIRSIQQQLDPRPGRHFSSELPRYITPDVHIHLIDGRYVVHINDDDLPQLKINNYYRQALKNKKKTPSKTHSLQKASRLSRSARHTKGVEAKQYVTDKLNRAKWFMRSIELRKQTIVRVMESILEFQYDFFEKGPEYLKPLILKTIADEVDLHESTISRVTSNKYVDTPRGLYELKFFFNSSIQGTGSGDDLASEAVKMKIKKLISNENPQKPYSDQKLVELLKTEGVSVARRTVAKYRESINILSSSQRKQRF